MQSDTGGLPIGHIGGLIRFFDVAKMCDLLKIRLLLHWSYLSSSNQVNQR